MSDARRHDIEADAAAPMRTIHVLHEGRALCDTEGVQGKLPKDWPIAHFWVSFEDARKDPNLVSCRVCAHAVLNTWQGRSLKAEREWVTIGRIKVDLETETETFERMTAADMAWEVFSACFENLEGFKPNKSDTRVQELFHYFTCGAHSEHMGRLITNRRTSS